MANCMVTGSRLKLAALLVAYLPLVAAAAAAEAPIRVEDDASLRRALGNARPGTRILIAPGRYRPGVYVHNRRGTAEAPIVIEGADENAPPVFEGGGEGWHLADCAYVTLRNLVVRGPSQNGINVDDGGTFDTPAHHIVLEGLRVENVGPRGNFDAIKLSGLDDFVVRNCTCEGWGGQAPDMVGCHRGLIEGCRFVGREGFSQNTGPQTKGGSCEITIRRCLFLDCADRGVQIGGSTGLRVFRPQDAPYEAKDVTVEGCTFVGCEAAAAYVGADGATVRFCTIYHPRKWVIRILQETVGPRFPPCRNGRFEHNLVVFRQADVQTFVNVGPNTAPETFTFAENLWYCDDRPSASRPELPAPERNGLYGVDPKLADPAKLDFRPQNPTAAKYGAHAWPAAGS